MEPDARPTFSSSVSSLLQASSTASAIPEELEKFAAAASAYSFSEILACEVSRRLFIKFHECCFSKLNDLHKVFMENFCSVILFIVNQII
jgi:hypothetical protein